MLIKNTPMHFGVVAILLHWLMAFLIIGLVILGFYMISLPWSLEKFKLYGWHKEYGFLALFLAGFRLIWRLYNIRPELALPRPEKIAALSMHWTFYLLMLAMPLTGWLITSAAGLPVSFLGLFVVPSLVAPSEEKRIFYESVHQWLGYALILAICIHSAAALKHHWVNKDDILRRMLS